MLARARRSVLAPLSSVQSDTRLKDAREWYDDPQTVHEYKVKPEVLWMPHLSVREAILQFCEEVEYVTVQLEETQGELGDVAVRPVPDERVDGQECQWTVDDARYTLHAHGERIAPETERATMSEHTRNNE